MPLTYNLQNLQKFHDSHSKASDKSQIIPSTWNVLLKDFNALSADLKAAFSVNIPLLKPKYSGTSVSLECTNGLVCCTWSSEVH